ncbi:MAG TPA: DUF885 family protein [Longimicrobiales bacterium]
MTTRRGASTASRAAVLLLALTCGWAVARPAAAQRPPADAGVRGAAASYVPDLTELVARSSSELRDVVERYAADLSALERRYDAEYSAARIAALRAFHEAWLSDLERIDFEALGQEGRIDYVLLRNEIEYSLRLLDRQETLRSETAPLMPFADTILQLHAALRRMEWLDPAAAARTLTNLGDAIVATRAAVRAGLEPDGGPGAVRTTKIVAYRAADILGGVRRTLEHWYEFYHGYDPLFTWWAEAPYERADSLLADYIGVLRREVVGIRRGEEPIVGVPIGRDALMVDLDHEMIPYTPEELIEIARREFAWCVAEMKKAAREMGYGDDWKAALEAVKQSYVPPGEQPELVRRLAREAEAYVEEHDLVTVPPLARDVWRMEMMSPERQLVNPFFLGGEVIRVSYPTNTMAHADKMMSMRGNNPHFSRATVFHELIPGHHLQGFMNRRYFPHRRLFSTPFWNEGNSLYWEMLLWDLGFTHTPEDRVGALFWRMHRAARIIFSLGFHLGEMTPEECIDFLVDEVGHERANAEAEVRRSFNGSYSPLYQAAYMLGGLQFRALHHELVDSGKMTNREFHDAILQGGTMPVEMVRARLTGTPLTPDYEAHWRFYDVRDAS